MPSEHARGVHATWLYTLASVVFFVGFLDVLVVLITLESAASSREPAAIALVVLIIVSTVTQLRYCWFLRAGLRGGMPHPAWTAALIVPAAAVWVFGLFVPGNEFTAAVPLWIAASLIACLLQPGPRWLTLAAGALVFVAHPLIATLALDRAFEFGSRGTAWMLSIYTLLLPLMLLSSLWWWQVVVRLDRNRRIAAELAVTQERLRFASDLHDIQGHHLQVISLKSELAERLLDADPEAAREHIHETRLIAKRALEETRSLVAGYRQVAFDDELENAREVLAAAGADCELRLGGLPDDAAAQRALASVVREATTNILRHSEARRVRIELRTAGGRAELTIANDGVTDAGGLDAPGASAGTAGAGAGSGLAGLRERLAALGGTLETTTDAAGERFELRATVPVDAVGAVAASAEATP